MDRRMGGINWEYPLVADQSASSASVFVILTESFPEIILIFCDNLTRLVANIET